MAPFLQKAFGFDPTKHSVRSEIVGGITTFLTMAYILAVNPSIFSNLPGMPTSTRPVKEVKGFRKVHLSPGESVVVKFALSAQDLSYYNHELEWVCEPGEFEVMIGPNSRDTQSVMLTVTE